MQLPEDLKSFWNKARFKNQVLRRIACDGEFRGQDEFRAASHQTLVCLEDLLKIASQISDDGIELGEADFHSLLRRLCVTPRAAIPFCQLARLWTHHGPMLVTLVQSIVSAFDKYLTPLDEAGREKARNRAKNHLLEKSSVHGSFNSSGSASHVILYQKPHCFVFIIQRPRSRLVTAWVKMQEESLFVR